MELFVCWDGDKIGRRVGRAVLANDVGEVRRVDQAINAGNELWKAFALAAGGSIIEIGGDEGRIVIDASHLAEMPQIARRYAELVGATVSVGVGMKMSESAMALVVAKLRGGNVILVWDPETMGGEYQSAVEAPKSEKDKIGDEYLAKDDTPKGPQGQSAGGQDIALVMQHNTKKLTGPNAGFAVQHDPGFTTLKHPGDQLGEDSPPPAPPPGSAPPASSDGSGSGSPEDALHAAAEDQSKQDDSDSDQDSKDNESVKQKVADALVKVRKMLPDISKLQQFSPDAYKAIIGLVQGVILLGKQVSGDGPPMDDEPDAIKEAMGKSEESSPEESHASDEESKDELERAESSPIPGTPTHHKMNFPDGSTSNGKIKVRHGDGGTSWKQVESGMVQAQDRGAPLIGANSHPVSSREPSAS